MKIKTYDIQTAKTKEERDIIRNMFKKNFCNKCNKEIKYLNELEEEELKKNNSFVCSDCINEEMNKENKKFKSQDCEELNKKMELKK